VKSPSPDAEKAVSKTFVKNRHLDWSFILAVITFGIMLFGLAVITYGAIVGVSLFSIGFQIVTIGFVLLFVTIALLFVEDWLKKLKHGTNE
jgi:sterol desaturase/sphingolipid hydroxylase (fatty acid hydroxylase superfamily)